MGKSRPVILLLAILLFAANAFAIYDWQPLQQNNLMSAITNYGVLGQVKGGGDPYTFWPAPLIVDGIIQPPAMNYVYGWGLWVGAQTKSTRPGMTRDTMVTVGYNPNNATSEDTPGAVVGSVAQDPADSSAKIYVSTEADWPLKKTNGQDSIISMCDTRCVYNDYLTTAHAFGGRPLKVEITQTTYQWNVPMLQDIIYFLFEVKNTGTDTLFDVYLAPTVDADIGNESGTAANDVCYYDTTTNMAYQYQITAYEAGWSRDAGCVGYTFLQGPIATKDYTFPDARQIFAGDTLGLTHFKVFNINIDPPGNLEQYKELAGYDYTTGSYVPFDPKPDTARDQRFMESTGPIDIAPGQTAKVIVCLICANFDYAYMNIDDTLAIKELRQKARDAKAAFNSAIMGQTTISLSAPTTGSVFSGTQTISWTYGGNALATDSVDIYYSNDGYSWDSLAINQPNTGSYNWNTTNGPDGVRYKIFAVLHGPQKLASSVSGRFIVNNPGNAAPEMSLIGPDSTISGNYNWRWMAGDADQDEIVTSHYVMREGTGAWQQVAGMISSNPANTQIWQEYNYTWNTDTMLNAYYKLKTVCYDGQVTTTDSSIYYYQLYNPRVQYPGTITGHSSLPVFWYAYNSGLINGHSYEARFKPIVRGVYDTYKGIYSAAYKYDLWDMSTASMVSSDWTVPYDWDYTAYLYYKDATGQPYSGFAVLCGDTAFKPSLGIIDSLKRPVTDSSVDTLNWANITVPNMGWAKLNGNYEIRWHVMETYPSDTLWPEVWDITYGVVVPYDSTILNNVTTPSWNIGGAASVLGRRYVTSTWPTSALSFMNLCGYRVYFNRNATTRLMTWATHPQEGDIWRIYSSGPIPPREGDVYSFTPTGVEGVPSGIDATSLLLRQNAPNPFKQLTTINYQLAKPGLVNLKVYNIAGQLVRTLDEGYRIPGAHSIKWDGRDSQGNKVSSGIYIYRLQAENKDMTRKLVVLR